MGYHLKPVWILTCFGILLNFVHTTPAIAHETTVVTYVTKVQEERESTRWTLTEWLRIKERMKMMDVWLAMFSQPQKDTFQPEFNLGLSSMHGEWRDPVSQEAWTLSAREASAQLWLTNLVTSKTGLRTVNIDWGFEVYGRQIDSVETIANSAGLGLNTSDSGLTAGSTTQSASMNLRLLGSHSQDSSLVVKYGTYESSIGTSTDSQQGTGYKTMGLMGGAELTVYLLKWLGGEGHYTSYGDRASFMASDHIQGRMLEYGGFVEISLLRLMVGKYQETWSPTATTSERQEGGYYSGIRLQF